MTFPSTSLSSASPFPNVEPSAHWTTMVPAAEFLIVTPPELADPHPRCFPMLVRTNLDMVSRRLGSNSSVSASLTLLSAMSTILSCASAISAVRYGDFLTKFLNRMDVTFSIFAASEIFPAAIQIAVLHSSVSRGSSAGRSEYGIVGRATRSLGTCSSSNGVTQILDSYRCIHDATALLVEFPLAVGHLRGRVAREHSRIP
jgi:hypothetical protein